MAAPPAGPGVLGQGAERTRVAMATSETVPPATTLTGRVERLTFYNPQTGFSVEGAGAAAA